jgi:hypothetical protein
MQGLLSGRRLSTTPPHPARPGNRGSAVPAAKFALGGAGPLLRLAKLVGEIGHVRFQTGLFLGGCALHALQLLLCIHPANLGLTQLKLQLTHALVRLHRAGRGRTCAFMVAQGEPGQGGRSTRLASHLGLKCLELCLLMVAKGIQRGLGLQMGEVGVCGAAGTERKGRDGCRAPPFARALPDRPALASALPAAP